ncbi:hypothetical protein O3M35_010512 [Rhynocoris fuscipes]|uniref:Uncharacterized protein n=1 Tax=Rhynocoris fuscipes TaxID=488301 RepID=A0AAW1D1G6_9HEMI
MNIVIIGKSTHSDYAEVRQLACILSENHAHFSYKAVSYCPKRYKRILRIFNEIYKWDHVDPVLIFRHQGFPGGPVEYIGNIDQFHEFIYEYYGERRLINKCEAEKYIGTHLKEKRNHKYIRRSERNFKRRYTHVSIIGAGYNVEATEFLVYQLIKLKEIHNKDGIRIRLYDFDKYKQIELRNIIRRISFIEELVEPFTPVTVAKKIENAITTCDFLFLTGDVNRNEKLTTYETVKINQYIFTLIGQVVDIWASPNIKIILMNMDHLCFNANVLTDNLSKVPANNVVCVTQHLGVEPIGYISLATGIPAVHINNGFVWGFIGFSHLIDMKQTTVLFNQFKFTKRGSDLNFTESKINKKNYPYKIAEDRWIHRPLASVINNLQYIWYYVGTRKEYVRKVTGHSNYVSTVRMALELVKIWKCGLNQNACICVGVPSDKTYGFPRHMFISQPCKLINNKWKPFENFPIPNDIIDFEDIVLLASSLLKLCKVGASIYPKCKWLRDIAKRRRKDQKFDTYEVKKAEQILLGVTTV